MISHEQRCIFIHIPECGGSSIERALGHHGGQDHRTMRDLAPISPAALSSVENADVLVRRFIRWGSTGRQNGSTVTRQQFRDYFKFTVVRDPWSRAYSAYRYIVRDESHRAALGISAGMPFAAFLPLFLGRGLLRPQTYWLRDARGDFPLDHICRFETLAADFHAACVGGALGAPPLQQPKDGQMQDWRRHYTPALAALVANAYAEEIKLFGFAFPAREAPARVAA